MKKKQLKNGFFLNTQTFTTALFFFIFLAGILMSCEKDYNLNLQNDGFEAIELNSTFKPSNLQLIQESFDGLLIDGRSGSRNQPLNWYWEHIIPEWDNAYATNIDNREVVFTPIALNGSFNNGTDKIGTLISYIDYKNTLRLKLQLIESFDQTSISKMEFFSGKAFQVNENGLFENEVIIKNGAIQHPYISSQNKYYNVLENDPNDQGGNLDPKPYWWYYWWWNWGDNDDGNNGTNITDKEPDFGWGTDEEEEGGFGGLPTICLLDFCPNGHSFANCSHPRCPCPLGTPDCTDDTSLTTGSSPDEYCNYFCIGCDCDVAVTSTIVTITCDCPENNDTGSDTPPTDGPQVHLVNIGGSSGNSSNSPSIVDIISQIIESEGNAGGGEGQNPPPCDELIDEDISSFGLDMLEDISNADNLPASFIVDFYQNQAGLAVLEAINLYSSDITQSSLSHALSNVNISTLNDSDFNSSDPTHNMKSSYAATSN